MYKNSKRKAAALPFAGFAVMVALVLLTACGKAPAGPGSSSGTAQQSSPSSSKAATEAVQATLAEDGSLIIPTQELSGTPVFYAYEAEGTPLELVAVLASDDTMRVAFNTCQVCYDSGRGYYLFEKGALVCQNCGNRFLIDQIGLQQGGCNPIPVADAAKTEEEGNLLVSADYLKEAAAVFENWKR